MRRFEIIEIVEYCPLDRTSTNVDNCQWCDYFDKRCENKIHCEYDEGES